MQDVDNDEKIKRERFTYVLILTGNDRGEIIHFKTNDWKVLPNFSKTHSLWSYKHTSVPNKNEAALEIKRAVSGFRHFTSLY